MYTRPFSDDEESESTTEVEVAAADGPEYAFEGFEVEFSEKVALTPPGSEKK